MRFLIISMIWVFLWASLSHGEAETATTNSIVLSIGRSATVHIAHDSHIDVANGAIISVVDLGHTIKVVGKKVGRTALLLERGGATSQTLNVEVLPEPMFRVYALLRDTVIGRRGLSIHVEDGQISIQGRLLRLSDWAALANAARSLPPHAYHFSAELDENMQAAAKKFFASQFTRAGLPILQLTFQPTSAVTVPSDAKDLIEQADKNLAAYGISINKDPMAVAIEPLIRVQILVAEFRKNFHQTFGLKWPLQVEGQLLPSLQTKSGEVLPISLQALEQSGAAKILASPTLLCRSGKEAKFLAGGEFPIKMMTLHRQDVVWKQYGILLHITPKANHDGQMSIGIVTDISTIDAAHSVDNVPGLLTNRIETHFDLTSSRTIALSGLIKKEWGDKKDGLPDLSRLPILGPLFSSREYNEDRTELVIFVTPSVETDAATVAEVQ